MLSKRITLIKTLVLAIAAFGSFYVGSAEAVVVSTGSGTLADVAANAEAQVPSLWHFGMAFLSVIGLGLIAASIFGFKKAKEMAQQGHADYFKPILGLVLGAGMLAAPSVMSIMINSTLGPGAQTDAEYTGIVNPSL